MTATFSTHSTVQAPKLLIALSAIVILGALASSAASRGLSVSVIIPASVVFGMGLYINGARHYEVMTDRIRTIGMLGQRELRFERIHALEDQQPKSLTSRLQSLLTGAPMSSAVEVKGDHSFWSPQHYLWVEDREGFLLAAREALAAWKATRVRQPI